MRLMFLGAAQIVTGSSYLLEAGKHKILIDCGMFQGSKAVTALNRRPFLYETTSLDAVILTHAHIDHSGLLPKLCKEGYKGPVYSTKVTAELCSIMLPDSAHIQEYDVEAANRKALRAGRSLAEPLYTIEDAYSCLKQFVTANYGEKIKITPEITIRFKDAGHIMGSSMVEVWVTEEEITTKLLFSGDIGQPNQPLVKDPAVIEKSDYIIMESTYGNRLHSDIDKEELLAQVVNDTYKSGGNIIIPSFAVGRTQVLLYYFAKLYKSGQIPNMPIIIDSPLAIAATNIFMKNPQDFDSEAYEMYTLDEGNPFQLPKLRFTQTSEESKALNSLPEPAIIISASGMADAGRILHHLKHNLWRPESSVLFVGFQAEGSLGRRLIEGAKRVKIIGEHISVKAKIYNIDGFSAHADQEQLITWLANFKCKPSNIFIVHGEYDSAKTFADILNTQYNFKTSIPKYGDTAVIEGSSWRLEETKFTLSPAVIRLHDYLAQFEKDYMEYRLRLEELLLKDPSKLGDILKKLEKIETFIRKTFTNL